MHIYHSLEMLYKETGSGITESFVKNPNEPEG